MDHCDTTYTMIHPHQRLPSIVLALALALLPDCGGGPSTPGPDPTPSLTVGSTAPAHFTATIDHASGRLTFVRVPASSGLTAKSVDSINDPSGANGDPTTADVDLTSPNPCTFPQGQFQCEVEMIWGSPTRTLPNPVVQIDKASIAGVATSQYDANNPDGSNPLGLDRDHGLWVYTNAGEPGCTELGCSTGPYYLTSKGSGFSTATRLWSFDDPSGQDVIYDILVWASLDFSTYELAGSNASYVDACAGGTSTTASSVRGIPLPFDVTVYNQDYGGSSGPATTVNLGVDGQMTLGSVPLAFPGSPPSSGLPSTSAPEPGVWPFWDDLKYGPGGQLCYQTIGTAPNRRFVAEWRGMDFADAPDQGSSLDFELFLDEGTSLIDLVYHTMVDAAGDTTGRAEGALAWVGTQNASGTAAVGEYQQPLFTSGTAATLVPRP